MGAGPRPAVGRSPERRHAGVRCRSASDACATRKSIIVRSMGKRRRLKGVAAVSGKCDGLALKNDHGMAISVVQR